MIYVVEHPSSHAFALSIFSNHPKTENVYMCFHNCVPVVLHPFTTAAAVQMNYADLKPCSCEGYYETTGMTMKHCDGVSASFLFAMFRTPMEMFTLHDVAFSTFGSRNASLEYRRRKEGRNPRRKVRLPCSLFGKNLLAGKVQHGMALVDDFVPFFFLYK